MSKEAQHDIVCDIVRVARDLGHIPKREEYLLHGRFTKHKVYAEFGNWTTALLAAGFHSKDLAQPLKPDKQDIRLKVFESIKKDAEERRPVTPPRIVRNGLIISDLHLPYQHPDAIPFILAVKEKYGPFDAVASSGDEVDYHALSFHDHDPDLLSAGHELTAAIQALKPLYESFPEVEIAHSNHGSLVQRKARHHGIPRFLLKSYQESLEAPETWVWKDEIIWQLPNGKKVLICHAKKGTAIQTSKKRGMSVIQGHLHSKFFIEFWSPVRGERHFAAQIGFLGDDASLALLYNKDDTERPIEGLLVLRDSIPHLIPMPLDLSGRWTGIVP